MTIDGLMGIINRAKSKGFDFYCRRTGSADAQFKVVFIEKGTLKYDGRLKASHIAGDIVPAADEALRKIDALILQRPDFRDRPDKDFSEVMRKRQGKAPLGSAKVPDFAEVFE